MTNPVETVVDKAATRLENRAARFLGKFTATVALGAIESIGKLLLGAGVLVFAATYCSNQAVDHHQDMRLDALEAEIHATE